LLLADHINEGRSRLNFSEWDRPNTDIDEVIDNITENEMPLWDFRLMHPEAQLTDSEKAQLITGMRATFQQDPPLPRPEGPEGD